MYVCVYIYIYIYIHNYIYRRLPTGEWKERSKKRPGTPLSDPSHDGKAPILFI